MAQAVQVIALAAAYVPGAHGFGAAALLEHSCPASQAVHVVCCVESWYSPSGHAVGSVMPSDGHLDPKTKL